jgi:hypothetical protein
VVEASIPEMRTALEQHRITLRDLVMLYLARIGMYEDKLHRSLRQMALLHSCSTFSRSCLSNNSSCSSATLQGGRPQQELSTLPIQELLMLLQHRSTLGIPKPQPEI